MATVGLAEAAKLTGRNQSTIHRAMKAGRVSFSLSPSGERRVDMAELHRVFGGNGSAIAPSKTAHEGELAALQRLLDEREETIRDLRADKEDLRRRLDQATALLPDRRPWWRRLVG